MLSVDEALDLVLARARARPETEISVREAAGLVLAEDVTSDIDSPPHDKALVDGYAVIASDLATGLAELEVLEEVTAGDVPRHAVTQGRTLRVMTGAPVPEGADAVVKIEQSELISEKPSRVRLAVERVGAGQNILRRAASLECGQRVLTAGVPLRAIEVGVLAEVGRAHVLAIPRPSVAVLATGNELVALGVRPAPGHIRNSNGPMLAAAARAAGAVAVDLGIARDDADELRRTIGFALESDVVIISGGVSAGVLDLVPGVLAELGVKQVFHKLRIKPGKPLWFGAHAGDAGDKLVFGLPGNPVSSLVCFELFVRPAIARLAGRRGGGLEETTATLDGEFVQRGTFPTYYPAQLATADGRAVVRPLRWQGSADLAALAGANALACFAGGEQTFAAGTAVRVLRLPSAW